mmetsp:Transcript_30815/g.91559  ORF Transcript_30815/g.91559 Transcript_30815/m.91559 type:complete len:213 (-) Transcript_30815:779-1417(-)
MVRLPSALSSTSTRARSRRVMSSSADASTPNTRSETLDVRRKLNSEFWSFGCTEKARISKSPFCFSMMSRAWLIRPWSNRWPCSSRSRDGHPTLPAAADAPSSLAMQPACCSAPATRGWKATPSGERGERMPSPMRPILCSAHLTGIGLASQNRSRCSAIRGPSAASAAAASPARPEAITAATAAGATLAVTEMTPSPPCSTYSRAAASSPE